METKYFSGAWHSNLDALSNRGNIYAKMTNNGKTENARVLITYTGTYMHGARRVLDFNVTPKSTGIYTFTGTQKLTMTATTKTDNEIIGNYFILFLGDTGFFKMNRVSSTAFDRIRFTDYTPLPYCIII